MGFHRQGPLMSTPQFVLSEGGREGILTMPHERKEVAAALVAGLVPGLAQLPCRSVTDC